MILYFLNFLSLSFIGNSIHAKYGFVMIDEYWQIFLAADEILAMSFLSAVPCMLDIT